jgi:hypothetical protein
MFAASKTASVSGGYQISRSLRFNSADTAYLNRTPASAGNRQTWTWSGWVKRSALGAYSTIFGHCSSDGLQQHTAWFRNDDTLQFYIYSSGYNLNLITTQVFRDVSAWYHIVIAQDTTQATDTNRAKIYVNGVQVTSFSTAAYPTQNANGFINSNVAHGIGSFPPALGSYFNGYQTEINFIDGQALTPSSFGETNIQTGVWQPKAYAGSYGTNGFYLNFSDNSNTTAATLGKDYSGNGNNWTPNNFSVTAGAGNDSLVDSPTLYGVDTGAGGEVRGNYCTFNPLDKASEVTVVNGNLDVTWSDVNGHSIRSTIAMKSGKWYTEVTVGGNSSIGIATQSFNMTSWVGSDANSWAYAPNGQKVTASSYSSFGTALSNGNIVGIAFDADSGKLWFSLNGTWQASGSPSTGANPAFTVTTAIDYFLAIGYWTSPTTNVNSFNTGQRPFAYTAPSGFKALCTQNLPTPTIGATTATQANKYFDAVLRNGGGSSGGTYSTTVNMANGALLWDKTRNQASSNYLMDSVRGISKLLSSNGTSGDITDAAWFTNFGSNSYTTGATDWGTGVTIVDWIWAAGAGTTNTAGSITSTVGASTTSGFSIVTYTGTGANATVGHGLGVAPSFIIVKRRDDGSSWNCYHISLGASQYIQIDGTGAAATNTGVWNNTAPTSSVFSIGTAFGGVNTNGGTHVAYCFAPIAGYSAFGSYTGNGSTDGPFVYTGFRPAYVLVKRSSSAGTNWQILDTKRSTYNVMADYLYASAANAESYDTSVGIDSLSNGFKIRGTDGNVNSNGATYIYMAFAESPFKYSIAR